MAEEQMKKAEEVQHSCFNLMRFFAEFPSLAFSFLDTKSRARLKRTCKQLHARLQEFDAVLANGGTASVANSSDGNGDTPPYYRVDLENTVAKLRWLANNNERTMLQRITKADFHEIAAGGSTGTVTHREHQFYERSKIVDGNLWILYHTYHQDFEVFDLDTGKKLIFHADRGATAAVGGSDPHKMNLLILDRHIDARFGLLAASLYMAGTGNPHGPCSGPYLHVWGLPNKNNNAVLHCDSTDHERAEDKVDPSDSRLRIDLRRPEHSIVAVSVVSKNMCAVVLKSKSQVGVEGRPCEDCGATDELECGHPRQYATGGVLQWHRIPDNGDYLLGAPPAVRYSDPGPRPRDHFCSTSCHLLACPKRLAVDAWAWNSEQWQHQCRRSREVDNDSGGNNRECKEASGNGGSAAEEPTYCWWPANTSLVCEHELLYHGGEHVNMVEILALDIQPDVSYNVGSDGNGILVLLVWNEIQLWHVGSRRLVRTCPLAESFCPSVANIAALEVHTATFQPCYGSIPEPRRGGQFLTECDEEALLATFAGGDGPPKVQCVVRIVIMVYDDEELDNQQLLLLDIQPFRHLKKSEGGIWADRLAIPTGVLNSGTVPAAERFLDIEWRRGGGLDIFKGGRTELDLGIQRKVHSNSLLKEIKLQGDGLQESKLAYEQQANDDLLRHSDRQRRPIMVYVDSHKLVVATKYEISVWPYSLNSACTDAWIQQMVTATESSDQLPPPNVSGRFRDKLYLDKEIQPWHVAQPFKHDLFKEIAEELNLDCSEEDFADSVLARAVSSEHRLRLLEAVACSGHTIALSSLSWRYLAMAVAREEEDECDCWHLKAFDALGYMRAGKAVTDEVGIVLGSDQDEGFLEF